MTPDEVLLNAAALVKRGWTTGTGARGVTGRPVIVTGKAAVCWCAEGAIYMAARDNEELILQARTSLLRLLPAEVTSIMAWNDAPGRTQDEVVAALTAAAETCTKEGTEDQ